MENIKKLIEFYGSQEAWAQAWDVTPSAISQWVCAGQIPIKRLLFATSPSGGSFKAVVRKGSIVLIDNNRGQRNG